jgi:hypothetical protein
MERFFQKKSVVILIAILSLSALPFLLRGWIYSVRQSTLGTSNGK